MLITQGSLVRIQSGPLPATLSGDVAQLGERRLCKADVRGSSPLISTWLLFRTNAIDGRLETKTGGLKTNLRQKRGKQKMRPGDLPGRDVCVGLKGEEWS